MQFGKFLLRAICKKVYSDARMNPKRHSESSDNYGNNFASFSANGFVLSKSVRHCGQFESRSANIACRRSIFVNRSSAQESRSSGLAGGDSRRDRDSSQLEGSRSGLGTDSSTLKTRSSGITSRSSEGHRPPPFSKAAPPRGRTSRLLSNLLLQSSLQLK